VQAQEKAAEIALQQAEEERGATSSAQKRVAQLEEEMNQEMREAARERETLLQQLQGLQQSPQPSVEEVRIHPHLQKLHSLSKITTAEPCGLYMGKSWLLFSQIDAMPTPRPTASNGACMLSLGVASMLQL
jgi:hypothetical protein